VVDAMAKKINGILRSAIAYAKQGFPVLPLYGVENGVCMCHQGKKCRSPGKHPMTPNGVKDATTDLAQIKEWFGQRPYPNLGIATGNGLVVIDVDKKSGGYGSMDRLEKEFRKLPRNNVVRTGGGGLHIYLRSKDEIRNSSGKLGPGIDVRGDGGYVVAPPSVHVSGKRYIWDER
jgi:hypothetical protein